MSLFSEMMGSFIRTGNYPLEANYIFPTEAALKEFYNDPINKTTLHKGLLKIVENGGNGQLALYWVSKKQTNNELEFVKLIETLDIKNIDKELENLASRLDTEIKNRLDADTAIWGTTDPTSVTSELNSLLDISLAITNLIKEVNDIHKELIDSDEAIKKSLKTEIKALAGTQEIDIVEYLKTLPYNSLTEVANALHKFLNTVDNTSNQINTLPELKSFLEGYTDSDKLSKVLDDLYKKILGDPSPAKDFMSLRGVEDFIRILKSDLIHTDENIQSELDNTQVGIGLSGDGSFNSDKETHFLKDATSVMNALKILDALIAEAIAGITINVTNNDVVDLTVRKELDGYVIGAKLDLSNAFGNDLLKKEDGLYLGIHSTYDNGVLSLYVNNKLIALHNLGFSSIVESAQYDPSLESIIITFKLLNGERLVVNIPVGALIREFDIDNSNPGKVVELTREEVIDGPDRLSADVRIVSKKTNILKKEGNALIVEGISSNISHNGEALDLVLVGIKEDINNKHSYIEEKLDSEIKRAENAESSISKEILSSTTNINASIAELKTSDSKLEGSINNEINRATLEENTLKQRISDLQSSVLANTEKADNAIHNIELEKERALDAENTLKRDVSANKESIKVINDREVELSKEVDDLSAQVLNEITRASAEEKALKSSIETEATIARKAETNNKEAIALESSRAIKEEKELEENLKGEILRSKDAEVSLNESILNNTSRIDLVDANLRNQLSSLDTKVSNLKDDLTNAINAVSTSILVEKERALALENLLNESLSKKVENVKLEKTGEQSYNLFVDGISAGQINIPKDQFLESVTVVNNSTLRFVFITTEGKVTTDIDLDPIFYDDLLEKLDKKAPIESPILKGIPQVEISPDAKDSSQRIPSTNWVLDRIKEIDTLLTEVYFTKTEIMKLINRKADLTEDGLVPMNQLPKLGWIEVK